MRVSNMFPSKYLSAEDLQGSTPTVNMSHVTEEKMADGEYKHCLYFVGKQKGLILNKTNATTISQLYGDETEAWTGKPVQLFAIHTEFQGKPVLGLRVRAAPGQPTPTATAAATQAPVSDGYDERNPPAPDGDPLNDSIPF